MRAEFQLKKALYLITLVFAVALQPAWAAKKGDLPTARPEKVGMSSERLERLTDGMKAIVDEGRLAGVVTMVAKNGKVVHFEATGKASVESGAPMQKDTIFRIYSMSKPITGVAMMQLFEQGKWQLNDPVAKHIPEFAGLKVYSGTDAEGKTILKEQARPMTMRDLMAHTAGFTYGFFSNTAVDQLQRQADVLNIDITLDEMIKRVAQLPLNSQPGAQWQYSIAVDIQGYVVQKLSGMPFEEYLDKHIFKPLGMVDTAFYVPQEKVNRFAEVYTYDKSGKLTPVVGGFNHDFTKKPAMASGGGGLVSTISDYMRFCQMLLNGGQLNGVRILSPRTVELMRTNVLPSGMAILTPGSQFGLDFAVVMDPVAAGGYYGKGTYWWGGAAGTWFWIDPVNELIMIGMIQQMSGTGASTVSGVPDVRGLSRTFTYQAIVE
jgi:CubicO group peptidase (beta-lactamase class C family)